MRCSHCGVCCEATEMMLSNADVVQLGRAGYDRQKYARRDKHGFLRLRNQNGFCIFYDPAKRRCRIYTIRPEGCRMYPVVYSEQEGIVLDDLCPMNHTVSGAERARKGKKVTELVQRLRDEAASRSAQASLDE